jgi:hypothetical protein
VYRGQPAHASAAPWQGVNALDALVLAYQSISVLRQQILPNQRIHGIITKGGDAPNSTLNPQFSIYLFFCLLYFLLTLARFFFLFFFPFLQSSRTIPRAFITFEAGQQRSSLT